MVSGFSHQDLVFRGEKWLYAIGCKVVIRDGFKSRTKEIPDVIGWRNRTSILIEVKTNRADFLSDKNKPFRSNSSKGMGDWRFYLTPKGLINVCELPPGWGLLEATPKTILKTFGYPEFNRWSAKPFDGSKQDETVMLTAALHRMKIKGYLDSIYDKRYHQSN